MKRIMSIALALTLVLALGATALADTMTGGDWHVTFTDDEKMDDDLELNALGMADVLSGLQPGDDATFYLELSNENEAATDWYMTNEVLQSLEASQTVAEGGAYAYDLRYVGPDGQEDVLYTSSSVGGEGKAEQMPDQEGLNEATMSLEDWFYLDTLAKGEKGKITLNVALDGETQGNTYQDTLARLQMNFAVELNRTNPSTGRNDITWNPVRTGDETNLMLWSGIMLGCGLAALLLGIYTLKRNRKYKEENEDE